MDKKLASVEKEVLVDIVKVLQKQRKRGAKGAWKEFLASHDNKKLGLSVSDPAKRSIDDLVVFLKTFTEEEDFKLFEKIQQCHSNRKAATQLDNLESSPQKLVNLTIEHPEYPLSYSFPSHNEDWIVTKIGNGSKSKNSNTMISIDCEMVLCEDGSEALVQVCIVDHNLEVKLNELVKPDIPIIDFRTDITGISAKDLEGVTCTLADIQKSVKKLLSHGTILIGHSLNNDLQALKVDHARVIDTALIFQNLDDPSRRRPSLNHLSKTVLGSEVRAKGAAHNCLADARAAMKLVIAKLEKGFDRSIPPDNKKVSVDEPAKLLLHGVPVHVSKEELPKIFPVESNVQIETNNRKRGQYYSAAAVFKDPQEADEAFESIEGEEGKDISGRCQKKISIKLSTGQSVNFFVRKMVKDGPLDQCLSKKRLLIEDQETMVEQSKKPKTNSDQSEDHQKEIESLKKQLKSRDDEISDLQRIISALIRKNGL